MHIAWVEGTVTGQRENHIDMSNVKLQKKFMDADSESSHPAAKGYAFLQRYRAVRLQPKDCSAVSRLRFPENAKWKAMIFFSAV